MYLRCGEGLRGQRGVMDAAFYLPSGLGDDEDEENIVLGGQGGGSSWLQGLGGDVLDEANNDVY